MIRTIDHTADAGFEVESDNLEALFSEAAYALLDILYDRNNISKKEARNVSVSAPAVDILLHDFLSEILQIAQYELFLIAEVVITEINDRRVDAEFLGETFQRDRHQFLTEVKAVTYHQLAAEPRGDRWFGRVILDL